MEPTQQSTLFGPEQQDDAGSIFGDSRIDPSESERRVAEALWSYKGRANPIALRTLATVCRLTERELKGIIERLRLDHGLKIGASRREPYGYFVVVDLDDAIAALAPFKQQIFTMLKTCRRMATPAMFREFAGQLRLELSDEGGE